MTVAQARGCSAARASGRREDGLTASTAFSGELHPADAAAPAAGCQLYAALGRALALAAPGAEAKAGCFPVVQAAVLRRDIHAG